MNSTIRRRSIRRGIAAAAIAMAAATTAACGSDTPTAPSNIGDPVKDDSSTSGSACKGSAEYAERACQDGNAQSGQIREPDAEGWIR